MGASIVFGIDLGQLATRESLLAFIVGSAATFVFCRLKWNSMSNMPTSNNKNDTSFPHRVRNIWLAWGVIVLAVLAIGWRQESATRHNLDCQRQFTEALRARSVVAQQDQQANVRAQEALQLWIFSLLNPPPDIKDLPQDDPARREWGIKLTQDYLATVDAIGKERAANEVIRQQNPLPQPTCGMK